MKAPSGLHTVRYVFTLLTAVALLLSCSSAFAAEVPILAEEQKTLYAIGVSLSRSLTVFDLSPAEFEYVRQGLLDAQGGKAETFDLPTYNVKIQELAKTRRKAAAEKQVAGGKAFLEEAAQEKGAVKTPSGMVYLSRSEGKGESPTKADIVTVNYRGTLVDGKEFDSSYRRGRPLEFKLENVIACWVEGIQKMKPGGKARFVCPPNLAYGDSGAGELVLPGATLAFEVELIAVKPATVPNAASTAPAAPAAQ